MAYLEELLPEFRKGAKIRLTEWEDNLYIYFKNGTIYGEDNKPLKYLLNDIYGWFYNPRWELYQEPIDWDYIIKNKCLCWFWYLEEEKKVAGLLADYDSWESQFGRYKGKNVAVTYFDHCRPVRRDEVNFYEDKKDV